MHGTLRSHLSMYVDFPAGVKLIVTPCRVWLGFLTTTALLTAPLTLAQNPVGTIQVDLLAPPGIRNW